MFLAIDASSLGYINYIFYVVLLLAILAGFLKGFKKSIFNLITMAIFYIVFFVTINQVVEFLWTFEMPWLGSVLGQVDPTLSSFTTFETSMQELINIALPDFDLTSASAEVLALVVGLMKFVVKIIWTILYFTVVFVVYKILCWLIRVIFFKSKKGENKNRGLGTIIGALNGVMAVFVLLIMLGGIMSVAESASILVSSTQDEGSPVDEVSFTPMEFAWGYDTSLIYEEAEETDPLAEYSEQLTTIVETYNNNIVVKLANNITIPSSLNEDIEVPLHLDLFDRVLSFNYDEQSIGIRYELSVFALAGQVFLESDYYQSNDITDLTGDEIRDVFTNISKSNLVTSLLPVAIEVYSDMNEVDIQIEHDQLYAINYETELANLGGIAGALFDILNNADFIGGEGSVSDLEVNETTVRTIFSNIAGSQVISLLTESILLPMLEDEENEFSTYVTVPEDFDIEAEYVAIGEIFAEIVSSEIDFSDFAEADVSVLLGAASQVDLQVLKDSQLVSSALINILSGNTEIEGLDILEIPTGLVWEDTELVDGELTKILASLNVLADVATNLDFDNLDVTILSDLTSVQINTLFNSYVIRATLSKIIEDTDMGDIPLVFPDNIYDAQDYFTKDELVAVVESVSLILTAAGDDFDIIQALSLSEADILVLLNSDIISATIGKEIYDLGTDSLVVPTSVVTQVVVESANVSVVNETEISNILQALSVLEIQSLDSMSFDASIIDVLGNNSNEFVPEKADKLTASAIVHATVSDMIIDLTSSTLDIPDLDVNGSPLKYMDGGLEYISTSEITNLLNALYDIGVDDFATMNFDDTSLLLNSLDDLLVSSIIQATVSNQITEISALTIPEIDTNDETIIIVQGAQTYISRDELNNLIAVLNMLSLEPTELSSTFSLANYSDEPSQTTLLNSAIMHATISDTLTGLGSSILIVPLTDETGNPIQIEKGSLGNETTFVEKEEIKDLINAFIEMNFTDLDSFGTGIDTSKFLDNADEMLESSSLQATISNIILTSDAVDTPNPADAVLRIPNEDQSAVDIRIEQSDVTYISYAELTKFIASLNELGISDFDTFGFSASDIYGLSDLNTFFDSDIMQASASKYILDIAGDEDTLTGTAVLLVPSTRRETINIDTSTSEQVEKAELINIFTVLSNLGLSNFNDSITPSIIQGLSKTELKDDVLISASFHVTIDNMLRDNPTLGDSIPNIAKAEYYDLTNELTTIDECADLIYGLNKILNGGNFMSTAINENDILNMEATDRAETVYSLTIRQFITPGLEAEATISPTFSFDPVDDYEVTDPLDDSILDYDATIAALVEFHTT